MITDTKKGGAGRRHVSAYARYMVSAKDHPDAKQDERVLLVQSDNMISPAVPDPSNSKACRDFAKSVAMKHQQWIEEARDGKPAPKSWFQSGSISFSESDSKGLTPQQALDITREAVKEVMGADRPCLYAVHGDTDCLHVHFLASSVDAKGRIYAKAFDFREWEKSMERLELKHGLERVLQRKAMEKDDPKREIKIKAPSRSELEIAVKNGTPSPKIQALRVLDAARSEAKTMTQFMDFVEAHGYEIVPGSGTEKIAGYKLRCPDGVMIKGSDFGKSYSWGGIVKGGISYEQDRDFAAVDVRRKREAARAFGIEQEVRNDRRESVENHSISSTAPAGIGNGNDPARNPRFAGDGFDALVERLRVTTGAGKKVDGGNDQTRPLSDDPALRSGTKISERNERGSEHDVISSGRDQRTSQRSEQRQNRIDNNTVRDSDGGNARKYDIADFSQAAVSVRRDISDHSDNERLSTTATATSEKKYVAKQIEAWNRQIKALGLTDDDKIRVAVIGRKPGSVSGIPYPSVTSVMMQTSEARKENEVFWTISDVRKNIEAGRMAAWNRDRDVLMTPYSKDYHYVFVDDTKPEALKLAGYTPCLVQETSKNNYQAIIKVPKSKDDTELVAINRLCLNINRRLGDVGAGYAEHSFRLAGFANRKSGRDGHFTQIDMRNSRYGHVCKAATEELTYWREAIREERKDATYDAGVQTWRALARIEAKAPDSDCRVVAGAIRRWTGILRIGGHVDQSLVDYRVAEELILKDWDKDRIAKALHAMSPDLQDRKGKWSPDYISRTIEKASQSKQVTQAQRRNAAQVSEKRAPAIVPSLNEQIKPKEEQRRSYGPRF